MRTTVTIDDDLYEAAAALCKGASPSAVMARACKVLVEVESAKRLRKLGGSAPGFSVPDRASRGAMQQRVAEKDGAEYGKQK